MRRRFLIHALIALNIGLLAGALCYFRAVTDSTGAFDFGWALSIARDLLAGRDPYAFTPSPLKVPYPLPVAVFGLPLVGLSDAAAGAIFFGCSSALLAFGILRAGDPWRLFVFLSWPYLEALMYVQWSPIIAASWWLPVLAPLLLIIKPHTAAPIALQRLSWRGIALAGAVLLASLAVYPSWPGRWLAMLGPYQRIIPVAVLPLGPLFLLAALRWRDERARLLLGIALFPLRAPYDLCTLWCVPGSRRGILLLTLVSWFGQFFVLLFGLAGGMVVVMLPALILVLWSDRRAAAPGPRTPVAGGLRHERLH